MSENLTENHRTRVAAERRGRMRARLIETAMLVFADKGISANAIQEVIALAEVSQGTFYNYFRTNEDLLAAVAQELNDELMRLIEAEVGQYDDPALRIASGVRLFLHTARAYPLLARFVCAAGVHTVSPSSLIYVYLPVHIQQGLDKKRFLGISVDVALDLIAGTALASIRRYADPRETDVLPEAVVAAILRGLGADHTLADTLAASPLPAIVVPETSLLERGHARMQKLLGTATDAV
jgi:AcrR family transcriptional regulator